MNDIINAIFEMAGGCFLWLNVMKLYKAKCVRGVSVACYIFYLGWGYWNLYYYPSLNQMWSLIGTTSVVLANTVWVYLAWKYRGR